MRLLKLFAVLAALTTVAAGVARADSVGPPWGPETPNFNLEAILRPVADGPDNGFGLVKFRQPNDTDKIAYLDVWVRDLTPNHGYLLQRAVDDANVVDSNCTSGGWLTLGAISTDDRGTGSAALFRNLPSSVGTTFDIHFRVIDAATSAVALESACYQFTISQ